MKIVVVRIRGPVGVRHDIEKAMQLLCLKTKNSCMVVEESPSVKGFLQKIKSFVTWGPASENTLKLLQKKKLKGKSYRLNPPRKGFESGGIKRAFTAGGALGNRGEHINDLIERMV